jgi:general secretion pathway protein G
MMKNERQGERGFSLLEILAVLTLLAFILMMVAPNIISNMQKGQISAAKSQVNSMKSVLNSYYMDNSTFPSTEQGLKALFEKPGLPPTPENWNGPYTEGKTIPKDPWGHELHYFCPGVHNPQAYDVFSYGKDNAEGGTDANADIGNW